MFHRRETALPLLFLAAALLLQAPFGPAEAKLFKKKKDKEEEIVRTAFSPTGGWEAYLKGPQGEQYVLELPIEKNPDIHWLGLEFTEWDGARFRLAVMKVENKIETSTVEVEFDEDDDADDRRRAQETASRAAIPLGSLEGLVTSALFNTHRFELIERKQIDAVLNELKFNSTELISGPSASKVGRLLGAQYMLFVEVAEFDDSRNLMSDLGFAKTNAQVAVTFRLLEVATGRIDYAQTFRGKAGSWGITMPFFGHHENSPTHYALSVCVAKAAYDLSSSLKDKSWRGAVVKVDGDMVTLNAGTNQGIKPGMKMTAYSKGEELIDPATGTSLGTDDEIIGSLQVISVTEKISKAAVIEGCKGLKVGDPILVLSGGEAAKVVETVKAPTAGSVTHPAPPAGDPPSASPKAGSATKGGSR
jgi:hypothetical protein